MKKSAHKLIIVIVVLTLISTAAIASCILSRDYIIIYNGLKVYRTIVTICGAIIIALVVCIVLSTLKLRKCLTMLSDDHDTYSENDKQKMLKKLVTYQTGKWKDLRGMKKILQQLTNEYEYHSNVEDFLKKFNGLGDKPATIIQRVENCMYTNIQKLLNYMQVLPIKDMSLMQDKIFECEKKNAELLDKTQNFVIELVEYMNKDLSKDEDARAINHMSAYIDVTLDSLNKVDIYLT